MTQVDEIERLQIELAENPKSLSFVRLAEMYLDREMAADAESLVRRSLKFHPHSVSGLLLLSRILKKLEQSEHALPYLQKAVQLASENWQAWLQMAEVYAELQNGKMALSCFKKVLFLNPSHPLARRAVGKLEVLTADEYDEDLFSMQPLHLAELKAETEPQPKTAWTKIPGSLERMLAFVDALTVRLDVKKALEMLNDCTKKYGPHPEIDSRRLKLVTYDSPDFIAPNNPNKSSLAMADLVHTRKVSVLRELLRRIELKQRDRLSTHT